MKSTTRAFAASYLLIIISAIPPMVGAQANGKARAHRQKDVPITILQTTDLHHHANGVDHVGLDVNPFTGTGVVGSYARIASYVEYVRATAGHQVILVDSGDWTMGTLYDFTLSSRPLALGFLQLMRYDCVTLGNHEFDYTPKGLAQILGSAQASFGFNTPIVATNMNLAGDADLAPFVGDSKLIQSSRIETLANGLKVGYIGLMGKNAAADSVSSPVTFTPLSSDYPAIQAIVDEMRNDEGVDIIVALSHSGTDSSGNSGEDVDPAAHVTGINVIASGHTHTPLSSAHTVMNGGWATEIVDAGAYGTNVARIDLIYHRDLKTTTLAGSMNVPMTNAGLKAVNPYLGPDPLLEAIVALTDRELNKELGPLFTQLFANYSAANLATGIYQPVGSAAQDMVFNGQDPVPAPNGLGDLAADADRNAPNAIIAQTFAAVGGNPANLPGYDFTPFQAAVVPTGILRDKLLKNVQLTFADVYDVLPLGITPDSTQSLPIGFPIISTYLELADLKKLCALQLVLQTNLASADFYLNLSGLQYSLSPSGSYVFFKYASAAGVLQVTSQKAAAGSASALQAMLALSTLGTDSGAALLAAYAGGNPYAAAMVKLNDTSPGPAQIGANLGTLGQVAVAAAADSAAGTTTLDALIVARAVTAIDTVSGFAPGDSANTGPATPLTAAARSRVAVDLYGVLLLGAVQAQFGTAITAYKSATGTDTLSAADLPGIMSNRIDAAPATPGVQELKEWMALLSYLDQGLGGSITPAYASSSNFTQFPTFGVAVQTRNASYPLPAIGQFVGTLSNLQSAP